MPNIAADQKGAQDNIYIVRYGFYDPNTNIFYEIEGTPQELKELFA